MKKLTIILLGAFILGAFSQGLYPSDGQEELKKEIVKVKYLRATEAYEILREYLSPKGKIQAIRRENILIIEDIPDIVSKLLNILQEIDVRPVDLQFTVELILGSTTSDEKGSSGKELKDDPIIKELRNVLKYKTYRLLDSSIIRVQDNMYSSQRMGGERISLKLDFRPHYIKEEKENLIQTELRLSKYLHHTREGKETSMTLIDTTLALKNGERTVVGVSKLDGRNDALILIISSWVLE